MAKHCYGDSWSGVDGPAPVPKRCPHTLNKTVLHMPDGRTRDAQGTHNGRTGWLNGRLRDAQRTRNGRSLLAMQILGHPGDAQGTRKGRARDAHLKFLKDGSQFSMDA
eukprot:1396460-Alexandrium_andersonii.AAC.1